MEPFEVGQRVRVPCHLIRAPFSDQYLAMIRFEGTNVSGLIDRNEVLENHVATGWVRGEILAVSESDVTLSVPKAFSGSYFTKSGEARVPIAWAREALRPHSAA